MWTLRGGTVERWNGGATSVLRKTLLLLKLLFEYFKLKRETRDRVHTRSSSGNLKRKP